MTAKNHINFIPKSLFNSFGAQMEALEDRALKL
jgi:hypothetical protein